jgi:diacylglycerol kinase family enzyme
MARNAPTLVPPTPITSARGPRSVDDPDPKRGGGGARVVLLCNPLAGGRWRNLAEVLDSPEAKGVRRIVTDEIDDVRRALADLGRRVDLLCIYGGDGTIFNVLNELGHVGSSAMPRVALLGGGTMNVTARSCGMSRSPADNFRKVMRAYSADHLTWRNVPLLAVNDGEREHLGFTFGIGPLIRMLAKYESGVKGPAATVKMAVSSVAAAVVGRDLPGAPLHEAQATIVADGETLPYGRFSAVFANTTGMINPHVKPFVGDRSRDSFHFLAYAGSSRHFALLAPMLARGHLPVDPKLLRGSVSGWRTALVSYAAAGELPTDPRYINKPAQTITLKTDEGHYTIDGELLPIEPGRELTVKLGPVVRLAVVEGRRLGPA